MNTFTRVAAVLALALPLASQAAVRADPERPAGARASAQASANAHFSDGELDRLLAPVALYPDGVLSHVLAAATYPLEVVEAARWSREHRDLRGEEAMDAVDEMDWDASVKALVAFPELLARMDSDLQWTQDLGDAFLSEEGNVMDRVQYLRDKADASGHLKQVEHVRVVREREYIYIEPEVAEVLYVPYYDPLVVYGAWWWPAYPPYRWVWWAGHPVSYYSYYGPFYWGIGFHVTPSFYFCAFNWPRREVVVVNHYNANNYYGHSPERYEGSSRWQHAPEHRHGVAYREPAQNAQWHRGYARPEPGAESPRGGHGRSDRADAGGDTQARQPRREWTVNRARDNREHNQSLQDRPRDSSSREQPRRDTGRWNSTAQEPSTPREQRREQRREESSEPRMESSEPRTERRDAVEQGSRQDRPVQRSERSSELRVERTEPRSEPRSQRSEQRPERTESRSERAEPRREDAPQRQENRQDQESRAGRPQQSRRQRPER